MVVSNISDAEPLLPPPSSCSLGCSLKHDENANRVRKETEFEENLDCPYLVNDTVKVMEGPFSGFSGVIEEVNLEKRKLKVTVKIFGRKTPLELGFMQVEKE